MRVTACSIAMLACTLLVVPTLAAQVREGPAHVETVGTAQRRVAPDRASVYLSVDTKADTAATAASMNARVVQAVLDTLRKAALDSAITTAGYTVGPNYERVAGNPEMVRSGYIARTSIRVRLTRIANVGRVIDVGLAKGATGVGSVTFESSTATMIRRAALADAAAAARQDAEEIAQAMGGRLGALLSTTSAPASPVADNVFFERAGVSQGMVSNTMITPGEIVIGARLVARWQFVPR